LEKLDRSAVATVDRSQRRDVARGRESLRFCIADRARRHRSPLEGRSRLDVVAGTPSGVSELHPELQTRAVVRWLAAERVDGPLVVPDSLVVRETGHRAVARLQRAGNRLRTLAVPAELEKVVRELGQREIRPVRVNLLEGRGNSTMDPDPIRWREICVQGLSDQRVREPIQPGSGGVLVDQDRRPGAREGLQRSLVLAENAAQKRNLELATDDRGGRQDAAIVDRERFETESD